MLAHSCPSGSWRKRAPLLLVRPVCQRPSPLLLPPLPTMASRFSGSRRRFSILSRKKNKSGEKVLFFITFLIRIISAKSSFLARGEIILHCKHNALVIYLCLEGIVLRCKNTTTGGKPFSFVFLRPLLSARERGLRAPLNSLKCLEQKGRKTTDDKKAKKSFESKRETVSFLRVTTFSRCKSRRLEWERGRDGTKNLQEKEVKYKFAPPSLSPGDFLV